MAGILVPRSNNAAPELAGFRIQTSAYGLPIPIVYGAARIAGNLIHYLPQDATKAGGGGSKWVPRASTGWNYRAAIALALCEGPLEPWEDLIVRTVWADKDEAKTWEQMTDALWLLFAGAADQDPWDYLTDNYPAQAVGYPLTVYVANPNLELPNNVLPNLSWEVLGLHMFDPDGEIFDALPSDVLIDFLTDPNHGLGFPSGAMGDLTVYEDYCAAAGLFVSPALTSLQPARTMIDELMLATNSALVWSAGLLKVIPYGDLALSGNGHTYTPNTTPIYDFTDADYLAAEGEDPVKIDRRDPADAYNQVTVEFESRLSYNADGDPVVRYDVDSVDAKADNAVNTSQLLPAPKLSLRMIKTREVARTVAQTQLQRHQLIPNRYHWSAGWKFSLLEPMDLVTLTDATCGLVATPVRILEVVELEDARGISFVAEDWPIGTATATLYPSQNGGGFLPDLNVAPGDTVIGSIFEPVPDLLKSPFEVWVAASGGQYWGGCEVYVSGDGDTYSHVGTIRQKARFGELTDSFNTGSPWPSVDTTNILYIDLAASGGAVQGVSDDDFDNYIPMAWVENEFLLYRDATLIDANAYYLQHLGRGLYNSPQTVRSAGTPVVLIDDAVFRLPFPEAQTGQTLYFKFLSFNVYGNALQALEDVTEYTHTIANDPLPAVNAQPQGTGSVDVDGNASLSGEGSSRIKSWRWDWSTSDYPDANTVAASGTLVNGRSFSAPDFTTLAFGETAYATLVGFTLPNGDGLVIPYIHVRCAFTNITGTRTDTYTTYDLVPLDATIPGVTTAMVKFNRIIDGSRWAIRCFQFDALLNLAAPGALNLIVPDGRELNTVSAEMRRTGTFGECILMVSTSPIPVYSPDGNTLGDIAASSTSWAPYDVILNTLSAGDPFTVFVVPSNNSMTTASETGYGGDVFVSYTMPNTGTR